MSVLPDEAVDEAFYALVAADPELLRAEFDELVDAAWGPPPDPPDEPRLPAHPSPRRTHRFTRGRFRRGRRADAATSPSERSPPGGNPPLRGLRAREARRVSGSDPN